MSEYDELPESKIERVALIEKILIASATGGSQDNPTYELIRRDLINDLSIRDLLPSFLRTYRNLDAFWPFIKNEAASYAERRQIISGAFTELMDNLEGFGNAPADGIASFALEKFDAEGVHFIWMKALERRRTDPEGAITLARTLLETVTKRIIEESGKSFLEKDDLPKLYFKAAELLNLAPNQHEEDAIKSILGGATQIVHGLGTLRNRFSDSHGRGGRLPVKASARHANLAVNTAGAIATFLVETFSERDGRN
jgi:hypothetical protein